MKFLESVRGIFGGANPAKPPEDVVAIGQAVAYLKALESHQSATPLALDALPVLSPFCGDLVISYVVDTGSALQFIQGRDLAKAGVDAEKLRAIGLANLEIKLSDAALTISKMGAFYTLLLDEHFDASMMLADKLWDEVMIEQIPGDVMAIATSRDILVFCCASSTEGIEHLRSLLGSLEERSHPVSRQLFLRDRATRTWSVFDGR